ncbi:MAG: hypothetical protein QME88_11145 [Actinomycetota bacterium]|nr:hypothetical protein [Actinomycetota bacterium]
MQALLMGRAVLLIASFIFLHRRRGVYPAALFHAASPAVLAAGCFLPNRVALLPRRHMDVLHGEHLPRGRQAGPAAGMEAEHGLAPAAGRGVFKPAVFWYNEDALLAECLVIPGFTRTDACLPQASPREEERTPAITANLLGAGED